MENSLLKEDQALEPDQILKVTALLYLKEALKKQEYEICQELVDTAKQLGVAPSDISSAITAYLRGDKTEERNEATQQKSRLRSYKEE